MLHAIIHNRLTHRHLLSHVTAAILLISQLQTVARADPPPLPRPEPVQKSKTAPANPPVRVTISKETTYITEPLRKDGYPDYLHYLNEKMSEGVTPENNAVVPLAKATGFLELEGVVREQYFKLLGVAALPENGDFFQPWPEFAAGVPIAEQPPKSLADTLSQEEYFGQLVDRPWAQPLNTEELRHLTNWIDANNRHLDSIVAASKRDRFYSPLVVPTSELDYPILIAAFLPDVYVVRESAKALQCRAMLRTAQSEFDAAAEDLLAAHRLATLISAKPMAVYIVAAETIESNARNAAIQLCARAGWSRKRIADFRSRWSAFSITRAIERAFDLGERLQFLDATCFIARDGWLSLLDIVSVITDLSGGEEPNPRQRRHWLLTFASTVMSMQVRWDVVLKKGNEWHDRLVQITSVQDRSRQTAALKYLDEDLRKLHREAKQLPTRTGYYFYPPTVTTNFTWKSLVGVILPTLPVVVRVWQYLETERSMFDVAMALEENRADTDRYPDALAKLLPGHISQIPVDNFTGSEIVYRPTDDGYVLYSLGKNGRDDGGKSANDQDEADDIVIRVPAVDFPANRSLSN